MEHPFWLQAVLIWWLLPCARQDWRDRRVVNLLTVPPFLAALPLAHWLGGANRLGLAVLVLVCVWLMWREGLLGAADAKVATVLAAAMPASLTLGLGVLWLWLALGRISRWIRPSSWPWSGIPGVTGLYCGVVLMACLNSALSITTVTLLYDSQLCWS